MTEKNIDLLLVKYFNNTAVKVELLELQEWASKNETAFKQAVQLNADLKKCYASNIEAKNGFENFKKEISTEGIVAMSTNFNWKNSLKYAALILAICSVGSWYFISNVNVNTEIASIDISKEIELKLGDGSVKVITEGKEQEILNNQGQLVTTQGKTALSYVAKQKKIALKKETYNTLFIPNGRTFKLVLSDGTRVALNAGSSLRYPVLFGNKGTRQVYLDGEGHFEVTKNKSQPFIVSTTTHNIKVFGTIFNVNSYREDHRMQTVLVEGSVGIYSKESSGKEEDIVLLEPQQKATWNPESNLIIIEPIKTDQYTAWVDGTLMFVNTPFREMIKKMERHYNVTIQNNVQALEEHVFTATFKDESIDQVMRAIQLYSHFNYSINNNQIIINQTLNQTKPMTE